MRVISGYLKGRKISTPKGQKTRPTADRVKEAVFNVLGETTDSCVLDLYAGSGSLSIEALSRGAKEAVLVEKSKAALHSITKNVKNFGLEDKTEIFPMPVEKALTKLPGRTFDIVFADPPYDTDPLYLAELMSNIKSLSLLGKEGIIVLEYGSRTDLNLNLFNKVKVKKYGDTKIYFLKI